MTYPYLCEECGGEDFHTEQTMALIVKAVVEYPTEDSLLHYRKRIETARYSMPLGEVKVVCSSCEVEVEAEIGEPL